MPVITEATRGMRLSSAPTLSWRYFPLLDKKVPCHFNNTALLALGGLKDDTGHFYSSFDCKKVGGVFPSANVWKYKRDGTTGPFPHSLK